MEIIINVTDSEIEKFADDLAKEKIKEDYTKILKPPKKIQKELIGIYFDKKVAKAIKEITNDLPRGAQSKIVNDIMKKALESAGYME